VDELKLKVRSEKNEVVLLHGTNPSAVADIMCSGLDPKLARPGMFGRGTYLAEDAAKADQYMTEDKEWVGSNYSDDKINTLHNKLYPTKEDFPTEGNVCYAFVCRAALGPSPFVTKDGQKDVKGRRLFEDHRKSSLTLGKHALVAEAGGDDHLVHRYREFVLFDQDALHLEYLVCLTRTKKYCRCDPWRPADQPSGTPLRERSIPGEGGLPRRTLLACSNSYKDPDTGKWVGGCGFTAVLPCCFCPVKDADGQFYSADGDSVHNRWQCKRGKCAFDRKIEQSKHRKTAGQKVAEDLDRDLDDGFIVADSESE